AEPLRLRCRTIRVCAFARSQRAAFARHAARRGAIARAHVRERRAAPHSPRCNRRVRLRCECAFALAVRCARLRTRCAARAVPHHVHDSFGPTRRRPLSLSARGAVGAGTCARCDRRRAALRRRRRSRFAAPVSDGRGERLLRCAERLDDRAETGVMRLLLWTATYWPYIGGVQVISEQLLGALRDRGYDACVVTDYGIGDLPDEEEHDGIGVHRFPFYRSLTARDPPLVLETQRRVDALERAFRPDVVHVNFDPSALFHLRTEVSRRAKIVVAFHGEIPAAGRPQTLLRTVLRSAHWV